LLPSATRAPHQASRPGSSTQPCRAAARLRARETRANAWCERGGAAREGSEARRCGRGAAS
jgi:hypothetical protein